MQMSFSFTQSRPRKKLLAEGQGLRRYPVMYNDFVLIGPKSDPADLKGTKDIVAAFKAIKRKENCFHLARRPIRHASSRN